MVKYRTDSFNLYQVFLEFNNKVKLVKFNAENCSFQIEKNRSKNDNFLNICVFIAMRFLLIASKNVYTC